MRQDCEREIATQIADLLSTLMSNHERLVSTDTLLVIRSVVMDLLKHPEPTPQDEEQARASSSVMDPLTLS